MVALLYRRPPSRSRTVTESMRERAGDGLPTSGSLGFEVNFMSRSVLAFLHAFAVGCL